MQLRSYFENNFCITIVIIILSLFILGCPPEVLLGTKQPWIQTAESSTAAGTFSTARQTGGALFVQAESYSVTDTCL